MFGCLFGLIRWFIALIVGIALFALFPGVFLVMFLIAAILWVFRTLLGL